MKVVVSEFCGLGNSVLLSRLFHTLKKNQNNEIIFVGNNKFSGLEIQKDNKYIDDIININKWSDYFKIIKHIFFLDILIVPLNSNPNIILLILLFLFTKKKIIFSSQFLKTLIFPKRKILEIIIFLKSVISKKFTLHKVTHSEHMHEIEINNEYVKSFIENNNVYTEENSLFYYNDDKIILKKYNLNSNPFFVIQLFSANGSLTPKNWGIENFNLLIHQLKRKFTNFKIVLVGDEGDNKKNYNLDSENVINLLSKTSINDLISLLKKSKFIVCHDSSILHLADAMNLKNISLFGPTNLKKNKPLNNNSFYLFKNLQCSPCMGWSKKMNRSISEKEAYFNCTINHKCMKNISASEVLDIIVQNLKN